MAAPTTALASPMNWRRISDTASSLDMMSVAQTWRPILSSNRPGCGHMSDGLSRASQFPSVRTDPGRLDGGCPPDDLRFYKLLQILGRLPIGGDRVGAELLQSQPHRRGVERRHRRVVQFPDNRRRGTLRQEERQPVLGL